MTRPWTLALALLVGAGALLLATDAEARKRPNKFRRDGSYFHLKPGALAVDVDNTDLLGYQYGLGGGGFWSHRSGFAWAVGVDFEHWMHLTDFGDLHLLSLGPELRLGGSGNRWFAYGMFGTNLNIHIGDNLFILGDRADVGLGFPFAAGIQGLVTESFYIGTELGPDVNVIFYDTVFGTETDVFVALNWKILLGWRF